METLLSNKKMLINFWLVFESILQTMHWYFSKINIILHWPDCLPFISNKFRSENLVLNDTKFSTNNSFPFSSLFCLKRIDFTRESYFWLFLGDTWFIFSKFQFKTKLTSVLCGPASKVSIRKGICCSFRCKESFKAWPEKNF